MGEIGVGEGGDTAEDDAEVDGTVAAPDDADADAAGEGVVTAEVGGTVAALDGFPPFFFVMVGCVGYRVS